MLAVELINLMLVSVALMFMNDVSEIETFDTKPSINELWL